MRQPGGELLLIRHAITGAAGTLCGALDPPLNDEGRSQASALAGFLKKEPIARVFTSTLQRARETALPLVVARGLIPEEKHDLREISFGKWEGRRWRDVAESLPANTANFERGNLETPHGGESFGAFRDRVRRVLAQISDLTASGYTTAAVTHAGVIRVALTSAAFATGEGNIIANTPIGYGSVYRFELAAGNLRFLEAITLTDWASRTPSALHRGSSAAAPVNGG